MLLARLTRSVGLQAMWHLLTCVLNELRDVFQVQRARCTLPWARLLTGMSCSAEGGAAQSGHLMPNGSPISLSMLLVGMNRNARKISVTWADTRTLKFTFIVQRMPMTASSGTLRRFTINQQF